MVEAGRQISSCFDDTADLQSSSNGGLKDVRDLKVFASY